MVSQSREDDREVLGMVLGVMNTMAKWYLKTGDRHFLEMAETMEKRANFLQERIKNFDYSEKDAFWDRLMRPLWKQ